MAAIDKIYGTNEQWAEYTDWCKENLTCAVAHIYPKDYGDPTDRPICNNPESVDRMLWRKCPLPWVRARLREQYSTSIAGWEGLA